MPGVLVSFEKTLLNPMSNYFSRVLRVRVQLAMSLAHDSVRTQPLCFVSSSDWSVDCVTEVTGQLTTLQK